MLNLSNLIIVNAQAAFAMGVYWKLTYQPTRYLAQIIPAWRVKNGDADLSSSKGRYIMSSALIQVNGGGVRVNWSITMCFTNKAKRALYFKIRPIIKVAAIFSTHQISHTPPVATIIYQSILGFAPQTITISTSRLDKQLSAAMLRLKFLACWLFFPLIQ